MTLRRMDNVAIVVESLDTAVEDIDDTLARLRKHGALLVGDVVRYEESSRLCYIRGPEGFLIGLAEELGQGASPQQGRLPARN